MKKYFTSFVAASTVASFVAACHKKVKPKATTTDKKDTKKTEAKKTSPTTLKKGAIKKGQFKVGVVGSDHIATPKLQKLIEDYTQDIEDTTKVGENYFKLPTKLELKSSDKFNGGYESTSLNNLQKKLPKQAPQDQKLQEQVTAQVRALKKGLKTIIPFTGSERSGAKIGDKKTFILTSGSEYPTTLYDDYNFFRYSNRPLLLKSIAKLPTAPFGANFVNNFLTFYRPVNSAKNRFLTSPPYYDEIFTNTNLETIYKSLESTNPTGQQLYDAFEDAGINPDARFEFWNGYHPTTGYHWYVPLSDGAKTTGRIYFNKAKLGSNINDLGANALQVTKTFKELTDESKKEFKKLTDSYEKEFKQLTDSFKQESKKALSDKTQLASKNLDALFVQVSDGVENDEKVYKTVVEKKEFKNTNLFFIGDKAKSQSGSSSKTFAGGKVSTASYDKYAATYIAGFQAAVGTLKYSESEDSFVETSVAFLIGADGESDSKKKAFAFRRGVEAAKSHPAYSKYLKVKFVSKTEDPSKSSKKLFREVSEWKEKSDSKTKFYHFTSSDTFSDAERRVIYLAGTSAKDWIGQTKVGDIHSNHNENNLFWEGDDTGLIGALYNAKKPSAKATSAKGDSFDSLTDKTYSRNVWVVLDKAYGETWSDGRIWTGPQNDKGAKTDDRDRGKNRVLSNKHNLTQVYEGELVEQVALTFERKDVKFYGAVGKEPEGTKVYAKHALKALFMGGVNYMVGKHTIFGAPLDVSLTKNAGTALAEDAWNRNAEDHTNDNDKNEPWLLPKKGASKDKNKARYEDSLTHAWEKELSKDALVKESAWLK